MGATYDLDQKPFKTVRNERFGSIYIARCAASSYVHVLTAEAVCWGVAKW
jgi:hypothetical protein